MVTRLSLAVSSLFLVILTVLAALLEPQSSGTPGHRLHFTRPKLTLEGNLTFIAATGDWFADREQCVLDSPVIVRSTEWEAGTGRLSYDLRTNMLSLNRLQSEWLRVGILQTTTGGVPLLMEEPDFQFRFDGQGRAGLRQLTCQKILVYHLAIPQMLKTTGDLLLSSEQEQEKTDSANLRLRAKNCEIRATKTFLRAELSSVVLDLNGGRLTAGEAVMEPSRKRLHFVGQVRLLMNGVEYFPEYAFLDFEDARLATPDRTWSLKP